MLSRKPVVAGRFYPGSKSELAKYLSVTMKTRSDAVDALALVSPHAGYFYSGEVAAKVFSAVNLPDTILLLGPNHTGRGARAALHPKGAWETPLGVSKIDDDLFDALKAGVPALEEDAAAHEMEHSLEVLLPFVQYKNPHASIVPIALMLRSVDDIREVGQGIGEVLARYPKPVLIAVSSDMTHYESGESASRKDRLALNEVEKLDPLGLLKTVGAHNISMCGVIPAAVMLYAVNALGAKKATVVDYKTSGDASGDYSSVVGYAGIFIQ